MREVLPRRSWRLLLTAMLLCLFVGMSAAERQPLAQETPQKPNIVFLLTDDMSKRDLQYMPKTNKLLVDRGVSFDNAFVTYSLCCPSRATYLTGRYAHNHGIKGNFYPEGGHERFKELGLDGSTTATWLKAAGYRTGYVGKYMNEYDTLYVPPGWDYWRARKGGYSDKTLNEGGVAVQYPNGHFDNIFTRKAVSFVRDSAQPFFLQVGTHAPHGPYDVEPKYDGKFSGLKAPRTPNYNERDVSDKPSNIRQKERLKPTQIANIDEEYRERLQALQSVDEMVAAIVTALRDTEKLSSTYIVFTSDNGYHFGNHRLTVGKWRPYEEDIRVPLVVRGPGVSEGVRREQFALNNDLAPTFAEIAGAQEGQTEVDGRSLKPLFSETPPTAWRSAFLLENWVSRTVTGAPSPPEYHAVRTLNYFYAEYPRTGETEFYRMAVDPYQLESRHNSQNTDLLGKLKARLDALKSCVGETCRAAEGG